MTSKDIIELLKRYNSGTCTDDEKSLLESWYLQYKGGDFDLSNKELESIKNDLWQNIANPNRLKTNPLFWFRYAAAILIFASISIGFLYFSQRSVDELSSEQESVVKNDLTPGSNKATLTLADGNIISLDESDNGIIAQVEGMKISKTSNGQIVYKNTNIVPLVEEVEQIIRYNQISTPRGGQYHVVLPDGTKVWLNAASSIRYPVNFDGKTRYVELLGEAYFEVSHKSTSGNRVPFLVKSPTQTIEVLGTHFNINSYKDEEVVRTTLLEGAIRVSVKSTFAGNIETKNRLVLKPNQQLILSDNSFDVIKVDPEESVAWKNGYFSFENASIETVMRQLSRWYDVDIIYEGVIPKGEFTGKVYRNMNISKVLEVLAYAQVNFKIEGKKMFIFS